MRQRRFPLEVRQGGLNLGCPGEGCQLGFEGLFGRAVVETSPRCRVERRHDAAKLDRRELGDVAPARQEPPDPAVAVLDGTFLPGLCGSQK